MNDTALIAQLANDVFERHCSRDVVAAAEGGWSAELWHALEESGLTRVGVSEASGGSGGGWDEAAAVLRVAARYAAPVPLAETTVLAGWLLDSAGIALPAGALTQGIGVIESDGRVFRGRIARVPWARESAGIVVIARRGESQTIFVVPTERCRIERGTNIAREPRDTVIFDGVPLDGLASAMSEHTGTHARGAMVRAIQMAGALERVLELTVEYVKVRRQFGRALAEFQAVQQELALLAGESAAATASVANALAALRATGETPIRAVSRCRVEIAAAKIRAGAAATEGARIAHQLHGAIGVTHEHELHHLTSRLWSWREEYDGERSWAIWLGKELASAGGQGTWDLLTKREVAA